MNAPSPDGPPGDSPLDVERVEWVPATPETVSVLVVGRWRSSPPAVAPELIVESAYQRFPAVEHGVFEGRWRATFTGPIDLRPRPARRLRRRGGAARAR